MDRQQKKGFSFAEFEIEPATRKLRKEGEPLPLNAKAFDVLVYLIENAGRVVAKEELLNAVWEGQFVEEANLAVQISALRRVLGDRTSNPRFIATVPGRGYEFVGDVSESEEITIVDGSPRLRLVNYFTTMLTSRLGTTTTFAISLPSMCSFTLASASAIA